MNSGFEIRNAKKGGIAFKTRTFEKVKFYLVFALYLSIRKIHLGSLGWKIKLS